MIDPNHRHVSLRVNLAHPLSSEIRYNINMETNDPFEELEAALKPVRVRNDPRLPPFQGGAVGLFGYELGCYLEKLPAPKGGFDTPDMVLGLYDTVAAFDTQAGKAWIVAHDIDGDIAPARPPKAERAQALARRISDALPLGPIDWTAIGAWTSDLSRSEYEAMVARVIDYIHAGDIFQANVSQRLLADMPDGLSPMMLYRRLRALSPAPILPKRRDFPT